MVGLGASLLGVVVGASLGIIAGYRGGWLDTVTQRVMDAMLAFPMLLLALAMAAVLGPSLHNVIIALAMPIVPRASRIARSSVLVLKATAFIEAARATGCSDTRIMLRHVLPNTFAPLLVIATAYLGLAIVQEAALDYLGAGIQEPDAVVGPDDVRLRHVACAGRALDRHLSRACDLPHGACVKSSRRRDPRCARSQAATRLPVRANSRSQLSRTRSNEQERAAHEPLRRPEDRVPDFPRRHGRERPCDPTRTGGRGVRGRRHGNSRLLVARLRRGPPPHSRGAQSDGPAVRRRPSAARQHG